MKIMFKLKIVIIIYFCVLLLFSTVYASKEDFEDDKQNEGVAIGTVQEAFKRVDKNNDNKLTKKELQSDNVDDKDIIILANAANMPSMDVNGSPAELEVYSLIEKNKDAINNEYDRRRKNYGLEEQDTSIDKKDEQEALEDQIYTNQPSRNDEDRTSASSIDDLMSDADDFVSVGDSEKINQSSLQDFSNVMYNILLTIGIVVAVIVGAIIGIKLMSSGIDTKVEAKRLLIPYGFGCLAVFGAFAVWKIVVTILQGV